MRKITAALAAAVVGMLAAGQAEATSYFLDNSIAGNSDSNAGTVSSAPWSTLVHAAATMAQGDVLYIGSHHSETLGSATGVAFTGGSVVNPPLVFAVDDTAWSPGPHTPVSADLVDPSSAAFPVYNLTSGSLSFTGAFYIRGVKFTVTNGAGAQQNITFGSSANEQTCDRCLLDIENTSTASNINLNAGTSAYTLFTNLETKFGNTNQNIANFGLSEVRGNALGPLVAVSSSAVPIDLLNFGFNITFDGVDLSSAFSVLVTGTVNGTALFRNDKLNASTAITNATIQPAGIIRVETSSSSGVFCDVHWKENLGTVDQDTANFRSSGAQCNSAGISYKMVGAANTSPAEPVKAPPIDIGYLSSGSSTTISLYFMFDGANNTQGFNSTTLNNNQIWMRVANPQSSTSPIATFTTNKIADLLPSTTPATQGSAGGSWTTSGITTPETYVMTVTFTPQLAGHYTIYPEASMGANKAIWIDPQFTCTGNCS